MSLTLSLELSWRHKVDLETHIGVSPSMLSYPPGRSWEQEWGVGAPRPHPADQLGLGYGQPGMQLSL